MIDCFSFLSDYQWLHDFKVTNILKDNILNNLTDEWVTHLTSLTTEELNQLPFLGSTSQQQHPAWPSSFHEFLLKAQNLSLDRIQRQVQGHVPIDPSISKGMNLKKQHEVAHLSLLVNQVMQETDCNMVVDIGSGLGYLDHVLHQVYGHSVFGLEISQSHASSAEARAVKQGLQCGGVESKQFVVTNTEECFSQFEVMVRDYALRLTKPCSHSQLRDSGSCEDVRICLVGLHCCGDLSVDMMSLFHHVGTVRAMVGVGCCYHKMSFAAGQFDKFPLSQSGQESYRKVQEKNPGFEISPFTFRLGAQETRCRWVSQSAEDHKSHTRKVVYRALLEFTDIQSVVIRPAVRKCNFSSLESFVDTFVANSHHEKDVYDTFQAAVKALHDQHQPKFDLIEPFTCLQVIIQPVIESLIYQDRQCWLREKGHHLTQIIPVFDDAISPRSLALVVKKPP